ncbi:non-ribosomal peptide synthetase [Saccharomonospora glauca]|uniref:Amino acid adenylation enzyme/thioester reductase family protein n=2 Tax=Pseudonocardiaceae TaxID=2070 RepID=I1D211_9PSEU|nr:non-ribosomal peptide synthetase [Saccharomonospora glauca]EIE98985.1 amino acid adenylation enzyme/thioester reductase family protein [Saccharomonospora glauca K62]
MNGFEGWAGGLPERVARQAAATPDAVAVSCDGGALTYRELDEAANRLAHHLLLRGVRRDDVVGVCLPRRPRLVVALLGIQRAGAAFLPLSAEHPVERMSRMLTTAGARLLVVDTDPPVAVTGIDVLRLAEEQPRIDASPGKHAPVETDPEALAYVMFTSGSTGVPKGVAVPHRGIANRVDWAVTRYAFGSGDRMLQKTSLAFDASVWEFFGPLVSGGTVVLPPEGVERDPAAMADVLASEDITVLQGVPTFLRTLADEPMLGKCPSLRLIFSAGEPLSGDLAARLAARTGATVVNTYGPTECSIDVTFREYDGTPSRTVPIGHPLSETRVTVLDPSGAPADRGELYVSGAGLARGYVGQPRLTAARFVPDPFGPPGARAYRTGDVVRRRPEDGALEFLGRTDDQVKIRGIRVEPAEVEAVLAQHPGVASAAVVPRPGPGGTARLVGYVVPRSEAPSHEELRKHLLRQLPEAYVPSVFVTMPAFPVTLSGKIDRAALPDPAPTRAPVGPEPRTSLERTVASVFAEVLEVDAVGLDDDFFLLGGHSLLAIRVATRLRSALGVVVPVRVVFEERTVGGLAARLKGASAEGPREIRVLDPEERARPLPLSFAQQRLWLLDQLNPGSTMYQVRWAARLVGPVDVDALTVAVRGLVARHEILRTRYGCRPDGVPVQTVVESTGELRLVEVDEDVDAVIEDLTSRPFDLAEDLPLRAYLLRVDSRDHMLLLVMPHIVTDEWSEAIMVRELSELYSAHVEGRLPNLDRPAAHYVDYAVWQREHLSDEIVAHELDFWRRQLSGLEPLELPTDRPRQAVRDRRGAVVRHLVPAETARPLLTLGRQHGATPFMTFLGVFYALLARYTGIKDLAVGTVMSGRGHPALESTLGFFANTVVLRVDVSDDPDTHALLARVRDRSLDGFGHGELPFDRVVEELAPERDPDRSPLVDVTFGVREQPAERLRLPSVDVRRVEVDQTTAKFDLTMILVADGDGGYRMEIEYATELFTEETVRRLASHFTTLTEAMVARPDLPISRLSLMDSQQRWRQLREWNPPRCPVVEESAYEAFAEQAARTPDATAVVFGDVTFTYAALAAQAEALALRLAELGVGPEAPVAVVLERSPRVVAVLLGVLRAGGVYVPLDPELPESRLTELRDDLGAKVVITDRRCAVPASVLGAPLLFLDEPLDPRPARLPDGDPDRLAYMVYTSGSTGRPKAVMITNKAFTHHARVIAAALGYRSDERVLLNAPLHFDPALEQVLAPLLLGATVVVGEPGLVAPDELPDRIAEAAVTQVAIAPAYFREVVRSLRPGDPRMATVRTMVVAGDVVTHDDARRWADLGLAAGLTVLYGQTETTIAATTYSAGERDLLTEASETALPIGRPVPGTRIHVLDEHLEPVPVGVPGEIYLGGIRLARGFWRQPRQTADRFVPDPHGDEPGERLYRTGDRGRYRADGTLEFLGRVDSQVKIRGFRVELGEIEAVLTRHPAVRMAAAAVHTMPDGGRRLVGYVVPEPDTPAPAASELRSYSRARLPEYMVPTFFVTLPELPRFASQKVNRKALPKPEVSSEEDFVAPRDEVEEAIAEAWSEVLGVTRIGVEQEFFDLGGHSLLATRLAARLRDMFGIEVPLRLLFEATTVSAQAAALERLAEAEDDHAATAT